MTAALAEGFRQFFLRIGELIQQPPIAFRLLQWREVFALDVLQHGNLQGLGIAKLADHHWHFVDAGRLGRAPAPLSGDDFELTRLFRVGA